MGSRAGEAFSAAVILEGVGRVTGQAGPLERVQAVGASLVIAAVSAGLALYAEPGTQAERIGKAVAAVAGLVGLLYAYLQWRAARHEASYERHYDRLDVANRKFDAAMLERIKDRDSAAATHLWWMFVYAELDNLEYVLGKYRLRYVRPDLAERALRHFERRCRDTGFREAARHVITGQDGAYDGSTGAAVLAVTEPSRWGAA